MNNPRPTPETDAHQDDMHRVEFDEELAQTYNFARKLERERDILREAIKTANNDIIRIVQEGKASWETMKAVNSILSNLKPFLA